jgi:hypothetical protein
MGQQLFAGTALSILFDNNNRNIEDDIGRLSDDQVLAGPLDGLTKQIAENHLIQVPVLDIDGVYRTYEDATVPEYQVPNSNSDIQIGVPGRVHTLHVPYTGHQHIFYYMPPVPPRNSVVGATSDTEVMVYAAGAWFTADSITQKFQQDIETLAECLKRLGENGERYNSSLPSFVRPRLDRRYLRAKQTRQTTEGIKFPLRQVANAPQTYRLPEKPKQIAPQPVQHAAEKSFFLAEDDYQNILRICASMSLVMERSPRVFVTAGEEDIRVHYLVQLNGQYLGQATGETFNHIGKTDILIRHENENVFVAECKFWGGYQIMIETLDQLLSYTTWRDTRTALIIFSRNQGFTKVISEAQRAMMDHPHYKSGPTNESATRFRYVFTHPNDKQRDIIVTLMLFDMPKPVKATS